MRDLEGQMEKELFLPLHSQMAVGGRGPVTWVTEAQSFGSSSQQQHQGAGWEVDQVGLFIVLHYGMQAYQAAA